jgi:hypothetical protein
MPDPDADSALVNWFDNLRIMRRAAATLSLDTATALDRFACQKPAALLPDEAHQEQYAQLINRDTKLVVTSANVAAASTALDLLCTIYFPADPFVLGVFQQVAGDDQSLPNVFRAKLTSQVYPTDASRADLLAHLQAVMDSAWLSDTKRQKLLAKLVDLDATVQHCVSLVSTL